VYELWHDLFSIILNLLKEKEDVGFFSFFVLHTYTTGGK